MRSPSFSTSCFFWVRHDGPVGAQGPIGSADASRGSGIWKHCRFGPDAQPKLACLSWGSKKTDAGRGKEGRKRRKGPDATVPAKIQSAVYDQFTSRIGQPYRPVPAMNSLVSASTMRKVGTEWRVPGLGRVYLTVQPRMSQVCVPCAKREENKIPELNPRTNNMPVILRLHLHVYFSAL